MDLLDIAPAVSYLSYMSVRRPIHERCGVFFITFTCQSWLPLFELTDSYEVVYRWFDYLRSKAHYICGYVIMPNHVHVLIGIKASEQSIQTLVSNGKRFMAYELVARLEQQGQYAMLSQLSRAVTASDARRGKLHQVFKGSFDCKECYTEAFIQEKLNYIHQNPCKGKWDLAASPILYPHSSAKYYFVGEQGLYPVTLYTELMDVDLTKENL